MCSVGQDEVAEIPRKMLKWDASETQSEKGRPGRVKVVRVNSTKSKRRPSRFEGSRIGSDLTK